MRPLPFMTLLLALLAAGCGSRFHVSPGPEYQSAERLPGMGYALPYDGGIYDMGITRQQPGLPPTDLP